MSTENRVYLNMPRVNVRSWGRYRVRDMSWNELGRDYTLEICDGYRTGLGNGRRLHDGQGHFLRAEDAYRRLNGEAVVKACQVAASGILGPAGAALAAVSEHPVRPEDDVSALCRDAVKKGLAWLSVPAAQVALATRELGGSAVKVSARVRDAAEAQAAIASGAREIEARENLEEIARVCGDIPFTARVDTAGMTREEKLRAFGRACAAGATNVKVHRPAVFERQPTACVEDVGLLRARLGQKVGVVASAGALSGSFVRALLEVGADRLVL